MFAIVQNNEIVKTGGSIRTLFPNISFPAGGASAQFKADHGVVEVVSGEQKDQRFYWVTPANPSSATHRRCSNIHVYEHT
jgi:hypothetical protein